MDELSALGTWQGWAGPADRWPVTEHGRLVVRWALDTHERFFGDAWLTARAESRHHPLLSHYDWPLTNVLPVVQLLERACRIDCLREDYRIKRMHEQPADAVEFKHLELVLEITGLATRAGWQVELEQPVATGRRPDLLLKRSGAAFTVEVTRMAMDREMRASQLWCDGVSSRLLRVQTSTDASIVVSAERCADPDETDVAIESVAEAASATARDHMPRSIYKHGIRAKIGPRGESGPTYSFDGPAMTSDVYGRLAKRLVEKARQTHQGPPAWIRIDEVGGMFILTDWSRQAPRAQLTLLTHNVQATLSDHPHVRGIILSGGAAIGGVGTRDDTVVDASEGDAHIGGPAALIRHLPGSRARRTFIVPVRARRPILRSHVEAEPVHWYSREDSWLDWALLQRGFGTLGTILGQESS